VLLKVVKREPEEEEEEEGDDFIAFPPFAISSSVARWKSWGKGEGAN
jgi:hypothetical protein